MRLVRGMFTPFPGHIRTRLNVPRNAMSASTPSIARTGTPCDGLKILSLYVVYLCVLFMEQQIVTVLLKL